MTSSETIRTTHQPTGPSFGTRWCVSGIGRSSRPSRSLTSAPRKRPAAPIRCMCGAAMSWAGIVGLRVLWGFVGPRHARFSDFICGPVKAFRYLVDLLRRRSERYLEHSPAGGAMVIALLVCLAATVGTGLLAYGEQGKGPLAASSVTDAIANGNEAENRGRAEGGKRTESAIGDLHGVLANITLALVVLHILGVALASMVHRENLVLAMISGRKRVEPAIDR